MMRYVNVHEPALDTSEAAMLTALPAQTAMRRNNLIMPQTTAHFVPVEGTVTENAQSTARRGSVAGRAVLTAAGISLPGVQGMSRGCRRHQDRQQVRYTLEWL